MNKKCYWVYEKLFDYCLVFGRYKWFGCDRGAECCIDSSGMLTCVVDNFKVVSEIPSGVWSEKILDKVRDPFFEIDVRKIYGHVEWEFLEGISGLVVIGVLNVV